ncbi:MAG: adenine deaminase [Bacteroidota bacterium]|nr:adenine deaminase [Bacteroidota bacterium]
MKSISRHIVDIPNKRIYKGIVYFDNKIQNIEPADHVADQYILPGFIDAHVHIESSMLVPSEFARLAVVHGTVATVSDPHEIANVMGVKGVYFMIENGEKTPFKFNFGAPSCVPATKFETAGAEINADEIASLLKDERIKYLAEMMNWPGVLHNDKDVFNKIESAKRLSKPIDGHAPGLKGENASAYTSAGISTDHECFTIEEALDKLNAGMKILIREGSAAKNFEALADLINDFEDYTMFCSDDKHPDNLVEHHINDLVKRAVAKGIDLFKVLKTACINPMVHYGLEVGILRSGDAADFIIVENLSEFKVKRTYINGKLVAEDGSTKIKQVETSIINNFKVKHKSPDDFIIKGNSRIFPVIEAMDGQLVTNKLDLPVPLEDGIYSTDPEKDILKIIVLNRYEDKAPAVAFIRNFGLKRGAIASSVAHDSHNIIAVGVDDVSLAKAVNLIISAKGGISAVDDNIQKILELPVAGLMSAYDGYEVAKIYSEIDKVAKEMGSTLNSPFMTLSFMALLVIPKLKLSDHGLFNGEKFEYLEMERE